MSKLTRRLTFWAIVGMLAFGLYRSFRKFPRVTATMAVVLLVLWFLPLLFGNY
jgi:EamA domain-containing membrane protein RarD